MEERFAGRNAMTEAESEWCNVRTQPDIAGFEDGKGRYKRQGNDFLIEALEGMQRSLYF